MKFMKRALGQFHKISYEMPTSVRFYLSYDSFKLDLIFFKVGLIDIVMTLYVRAKMLCNE